MFYKIVNKTKNVEIACFAKIASGFYLRLLGLMFKNNLPEDQALIFYQAPSIHTFFMRFPIDIIFLDRQMKVKRIVNSLSPWRVVFCKGAYVTIELPVGKAKQNNISLGDKIELVT
ncbi:MAG: DUF192 domain-containing protein [Candidatus Omnitrophica bacterium]|nr:DUF192 domain-containing protein [Candidatus Omnitrophota bacterium]MCF7893917.1 DUF192 domain-containing protein [Candidatus Omnitrophota bacterium]